jgi:hypothetical protein
LRETLPGAGPARRGEAMRGATREPEVNVTTVITAEPETPR